MSLKNCPDCAAPLGLNGYKCRCGWQASHVTSGPSVDCDHCRVNRAVLHRDVRRQYPDAECPADAKGWANLCLACDEQMHYARAEKWCRGMGLDSVDARMAYCESMAMKSMPSKRQVWERVLENSKACHLAKQYATDVLKRYRNGRRLEERVEDVEALQPALEPR